MQLFDGTMQDISSFSDIATLITTIGNFVLGLVGIISVIFIIIGGIQLSVSGGNPKGQESAKKTITNAILGLIIAISAAAIGNFVLAAFGVS